MVKLTFTSDLFHFLLCFGKIRDVKRQDFCARLGQPHSEALTDAGRAPGNHRVLPFQRKQIRLLFLLSLNTMKAFSFINRIISHENAFINTV